MPKLTKRGPTNLAAGAPPPPVVESSSGSATALPAAPALDRPTTKDKVDVWRDYAETVGVDTDGLTKAQIIEAVDAAGG